MPLPYLPVECPAEVRHRGYQRRLQQIIAHERFPLLLQRVLELKSQMKGVPLGVDTATLLGNTEQLRRKHGVQYIIPAGENPALDLFIETSCNEFLAMLRDIHNAHAITTHAFNLVQQQMDVAPTRSLLIRPMPQQTGKRNVHGTVAYANHKRRIASALSQFVDSSETFQPSSDATETDDHSHSSAPATSVPAASSAPASSPPRPPQPRNKGKFDPWQQDILLRWLIEHEDHPYPKPKDKEELAAKTNLTPVQIQNWFTNMRKRHWLPIINGKKKPRSYLDMHLYLSHAKKKQSAQSAADPQSSGTARSSSSSGTGARAADQGASSRSLRPRPQQHVEAMFQTTTEQHDQQTGSSSSDAEANFTFQYSQHASIPQAATFPGFRPQQQHTQQMHQQQAAHPPFLQPYSS